MSFDLEMGFIKSFRALELSFIRPELASEPVLGRGEAEGWQ